MIDNPPVLRLACQWCSCGKHSIQYSDKDGRARVCLVCPRCDSPAFVAAAK